MDINHTLIRAVIFDMDGTLLDSEGISQMATEHGFKTVLGRSPSPDEHKRLIGRPVQKVLSQWFPKNGDRIYNTTRQYFLDNIGRIKAYDGIRELLEELKGKYRIAVVTSSHRPDAELLLSASRLRHFFELIVGQEDTNQQKPDPEPIILALDMMGVSSEEAIFVGDQPYDLIAAHEAGVAAVAALWGTGNINALYMYHPELECTKPEELGKFLKMK